MMLPKYFLFPHDYDLRSFKDKTKQAMQCQQQTTHQHASATYLYIRYNGMYYWHYYNKLH